MTDQPSRDQVPRGLRLFGVVFLGLGSLLLIAWVVVLIAAALRPDWQAFGDLLFRGEEP